MTKKNNFYEGLSTRLDSFVNAFTGRGTSRDRNTSTRFQSNHLLSDIGNLNLLNGDGVGHRVVDRWASDATREWVSINNDVDSDIVKIMELLKAQCEFKKALFFALGTGGSVIYMGIDDGATDPIEPLNTSKIQHIHFLKVYNKSQITKDNTDVDSDPASNRFGMQEFYNIHPNVGTNATTFRVHHSRILEFEGVVTDDDTWSNNGNFHLSMFQTLLKRLDALDAGYKAAQDGLENYVLDVLKMSGLFQMLQGGQKDEVIARLNLLDLSKHSNNTTALDADANESLERLATPITGLADLITKLENGVATVGGIPSIILYGQNGASGLNTNNDNEVRLYYDDVSSMQTEKLLDNIITLCGLIQLSKDGPTGGVVDPEKTIKFKSLWKETAKEKADNYKTTADGDAIYIDRGAPIEPFIEGRFKDNPDITIEESDIDLTDNTGHEGEEND